MTLRGGRALRWLWTYLVSFAQTQLVITLVALPVLVAWGLGYSVMSLLGNLLFAPVLTAFLVVSSLLLFAQLLSIPHAWLATILNWLTAAWDWALNHASPLWLIECAKPPTIMLIALPFIVYALLRHRWMSTPLRRVGALSFLLVASYGIFYIQRIYNANGSLTRCLDGKLYVIKLVGTEAIILIDDGYFARKKSIEKALSYEVRPWLAKEFGSVRIRELRMTRVGAGGLQAAQHMCSILPVESLWVPFFNNKLSKYAWRSFFDMKRTVAEKGIRLVRYNLHKAARACLNGKPSKTA
ncbi:MAG: hypothetical protein WCW33_03360 [Candidatus Babeliales bacterium]|jgi:hypothetical protein